MMLGNIRVFSSRKKRQPLWRHNVATHVFTWGGHMTGLAGLSYRWPSGLAMSADVLYGSGLLRGFANTLHLLSHTWVNVAVFETLDLGGGASR